MTIDLEVGEDPYADAVSWFSYQYGSAVPEILPDLPGWRLLEGEGNDLDAAEAVVIDVLGELVDHEEAVGWREPLVQCPGCELELPERDLAAQVAHMQTHHPDVVTERRAESERWAGWEDE